MKNFITQEKEKDQDSKTFVKKSFLTLAILTGFLTLGACQPKDDGQPPAPAVVASPYTYGQQVPGTCAGCFTGAMGNIFRTQMEQNGVLADITFWGDSTISTPYPFNDPNYPPVTNYRGPVQTNGFFEIKTAQGFGTCTLPVGHYDIRTMTAGNWTQGVASNIQMQAVVAGYTVNMTLNQFVVGPRPAGYQDWISVPRPHTGKGYMFLIINSINNVSCNMTLSISAY